MARWVCRFDRRSDVGVVMNNPYFRLWDWGKRHVLVFYPDDGSGFWAVQEWDKKPSKDEVDRIIGWVKRGIELGQRLTFNAIHNVNPIQEYGRFIDERGNEK